MSLGGVGVTTACGSDYLTLRPATHWGVRVCVCVCPCSLSVSQRGKGAHSHGSILARDELYPLAPGREESHCLASPGLKWSQASISLLIAHNSSDGAELASASWQTWLILWGLGSCFALGLMTYPSGPFFLWSEWVGFLIITERGSGSQHPGGLC